MAADRHRAFCVGAPRSLSVLRGKSDPLDTYRVICRTLRYYYKASRSSLSTGPHARNPGPRAQPPWAPRHCAFSNWDFSAPRAPNTVTDTVIILSPVAVPLDYRCTSCSSLESRICLGRRFTLAGHGRGPAPRARPMPESSGACGMRTHAGACSQARRASSERGHLQEPTSGPSPERPRAHARTTGASPSSSSSSLAPILATSELGCAVAPPEPFPRAHTRARTHTFAQPRTATYSHVQPRTATTTQRCLRGQLGPGASHTSATAQL